jgi:hypothetical protein
MSLFWLRFGFIGIEVFIVIERDDGIKTLFLRPTQLFSFKWTKIIQSDFSQNPFPY